MQKIKDLKESLEALSKEEKSFSKDFSSSLKMQEEFLQLCEELKRSYQSLQKKQSPSQIF